MSNTNYVYLVEVRFDKAAQEWTIRYHVTNTNSTLYPKTFKTRFFAVQFARRYCRNLAGLQGTNLRLEMQVYERDNQTIDIKDSYGRDPTEHQGMSERGRVPWHTFFWRCAVLLMLFGIGDKVNVDDLTMFLGFACFFASGFCVISPTTGRWHDER